MFPECNPRLDLAFVLDVSSWVTAEDHASLKEFVKQFILYADMDSGNIRVALVQLGSTASVAFHLGDHLKRQGAFWAVNAAPYDAGTASLNSALRILGSEVFRVAMGDRPEASNVAVIITDGVSSAGLTAAAVRQEVALLRSRDVDVYVIGVGAAAPSRLASVTSQLAATRVFHVQQFSDLSQSLREKLSFCARVPTGDTRVPRSPGLATDTTDSLSHLLAGRVVAGPNALLLYFISALAARFGHFVVSFSSIFC